MTTISTKQIQQALLDHGQSLGPDGADGVWGRNSIAAAKRFQKAKGLGVDGVVGPATLKALGLVSPALPSNAPALSPPPVWYTEARRKMGLHETQDNAELKKFLKSDGHTLGDPAKLPWCGDFVETCIALTLPDERMVVNPYYALNWLKFGVALTTPTLGCILVFQRPGGGHVGFYVGETATHYRVLGGNQSDRVTDSALIAKERCKGFRWPATAPLPTTGRTQVSGGTVSHNEA